MNGSLEFESGAGRMDEKGRGWEDTGRDGERFRGEPENGLHEEVSKR